MVRYKMLARDVNSNPTQYRTWVVSDTPDFDGYFYSGLKSGENELVDYSTYLLTDNNTIADFNLPLPANWRPTEIHWDFPIRKVLPDAIEDAQLAIIDGYAYMFGGKISNKIYRADLNNPADWIDTGSVLPSPLYGSQLAIVNETIYLFGGNNGDGYGIGSLDTIYSAPISNPLQWTNHGTRLPRKLHYSSLGMYDGYLYLFGGRELNIATDIIFKASTSDPLTWSDTGSKLPYAVYSAVIGQINDYWYLFGGQKTLNDVFNSIIKAPTSNPILWGIAGVLPHEAAAGQFFTAGDDGYIIGPVSADAGGYTSILHCKLSTPNQWVDVVNTIPGVISHSQLAIIYDRVWLFGGSGETAIFTCNQQLKYRLNNLAVIAYGNSTRVILPATDNLNNPFQALGFPYWKTDYNW